MIGIGIVSAATDSDLSDEANQTVATASAALEEAVEEAVASTTLVASPVASPSDVTTAGTDLAATSNSEDATGNDDLLNVVLGQLGSQPGSQSGEEEDSNVLDAAHTDADDFELALAAALDEEIDWRLL